MSQANDLLEQLGMVDEGRGNFPADYRSIESDGSVKASMNRFLYGHGVRGLEVIQYNGQFAKVMIVEQKKIIPLQRFLDAAEKMGGDKQRAGIQGGAFILPVDWKKAHKVLGPGS